MDVGRLPVGTDHQELIAARDDRDLGKGLLDASQEPVLLSEEIQHQVVAGDAQPQL